MTRFRLIAAPFRPGRRQTARAALLGIVMIACAACQSTPDADDSLYAQFGERAGLSQLTETLLLRIAGDSRISADFRRVDINRLHRMLTDYLCVTIDGPCTYTGDTMVNVHRGQDISSADFNALVEDLVRSMEERSIPTGAQNQLLARLAPLRHAVVDAPAPPPPELEELILGDLFRSRYSAPRSK